MYTFTNESLVLLKMTVNASYFYCSIMVLKGQPNGS